MRSGLHRPKVRIRTAVRHLSSPAIWHNSLQSFAILILEQSRVRGAVGWARVTNVDDCVHRRSQGGAQVAMPLKIIRTYSYFVLWEAASQTKERYLPKIKHFCPPNFWPRQMFWLATVLFGFNTWYCTCIQSSLVLCLNGWVQRNVVQPLAIATRAAFTTKAAMNYLAVPS